MKKKVNIITAMMVLALSACSAGQKDGMGENESQEDRWATAIEDSAGTGFQVPELKPVGSAETDQDIAMRNTADSEVPETAESSKAENETANIGETVNSFSYYGTWEIKDYQSAAISALSLEDMESFRGIMITYQSDSILLDGEKVTDDNFTYETEDAAYDYDSLTQDYNANLGEWWNNISEVTSVNIDSNECFFGNHFFVVDSDTIWIYYEGVFFLAKNIGDENTIRLIDNK